MVLIVGCGGPPEVPDDTAAPFAVVAVAPESGATDVVESVNPELRLSTIADIPSCTGIRLDGIDEAQEVAFAVPFSLSGESLGDTIHLDTLEPLPRGWTYALTGREGACLDTGGRPLEPFFSTFTVAP